MDIKRRSFIKAAAGAVAFPTILPSSVFGANAPSNRLRLGLIGVGQIGVSYHIPNFCKEDAIEMVSICDVDTRKYGKALSKIAESKSNKPSTYVHYEEMFESEDLDIISVALPDHWHVLCSMDALRRGYDVYCEKPLSRYQREGRILTDAVRRHQRVLQTGSQQRSMGGFQRAVELARNGYLGEVKRVWANVGMRMPRVCNLPAEPVPEGLNWDKWVGPADMTPYHERRFNGSYNHEKGWRGWIDYSISMFGDWGAHHFDIGQWGIGMERSGPVRVVPKTKSPRNATIFTYENGVEMIQKPFAGAGEQMQVTFEGTD